MKIDHLALWVKDLERMKEFYTRYFGATANEKYHNPTKDFTSYFLSFSDGCRLEIMHQPGIKDSINNAGTQSLGLIHFAMSVGGKEKVDELTEELRSDGFEVIGEPRTTGDGYYESVILDPENNRVEITE